MSLMEILFLHYVGGYSIQPHQLLIVGDLEYFGNTQINCHHNLRFPRFLGKHLLGRMYHIKLNQQLPKITLIIRIFKMQYCLITLVNKVR